jgi:hypothetical protein
MEKNYLEEIDKIMSYIPKLVNEEKKNGNHNNGLNHKPFQKKSLIEINNKVKEKIKSFNTNKKKKMKKRLNN